EHEEEEEKEEEYIKASSRRQVRENENRQLSFKYIFLKSSNVFSHRIEIVLVVSESKIAAQERRDRNSTGNRRV
ncbi:unnamed protein product, partial [Candidula unifasciata]